MIKRTMILLTGLLFAAACSGNESESTAKAPAAAEQEPPVVVETAAAPEAAPLETEAAEAAPSPTPRPAVAADSTTEEVAAAPESTVVVEGAVAPKAAFPEPDAVILCDGRPTPANPEGPFYTPGSPERASLIEEGMEGTRITISGRVLNTACEPVAGAKIDFWQTDAAGEYDNAGYRLRGHQYTGEDGAYNLETILPGQYPGRPAHIHLKIFDPAGREALTSQLYIPGISEGVPDGAFDQALLVKLFAADDGEQRGFFDFVVS